MDKGKDTDEKDFVTEYLEYTAGSEVPAIFNRWACLTGLGAWLQQDAYIPFVNGRIFANMYVMLIGSAGARKSTAIKGFKRILERAGYSYFAGEKTTKEQFLVDISKSDASSILGGSTEDILFSNIGKIDTELTTPCLIAADEFNDFFGNNMLEFLSMLGSLWDKEGVYSSRAKSGNIEIPNPNISILSGNTVDTLNNTFPVEALGQGFFSRVIYVYGKPNGTKIAFPTVGKEEDLEYFAKKLIKIKDCMRGEMQIEDEAKGAMEFIYKSFKGIDDERFDSYSSRRFTHFLKLCIIHAAANYSGVIKLQHVIDAHTVLVYTEHFMPSALGEYGRSKSSGAAQKVMKFMEERYEVATFNQLWDVVRTDVEKLQDFGNLVEGLIQADKLIRVPEGFLTKRTPLDKPKSKLFNWDYLTDEENERN